MWRIIEQEESVGKGEKISVECKVLKFRPQEDKHGGKTRFFPIPPMLQVIVQHDCGTQVKLKWTPKHAVHGQYTMQEPDRWEYPTIKLGRGRTREDTLSPKQKKAGEKKTYAAHSLFYSKVAERFGQSLAEYIRLLFEERMGELTEEETAEAA